MYFALGVGNGQTKAVAFERACHGVPKLSDILMRVMKNGALTGELSELLRLRVGTGDRNAASSVEGCWCLLGTSQSPFNRDPGRSTCAKWSQVEGESCRRTGRVSQAMLEFLLAFGD